MLPVVIQAHILMQHGIEERIRTNFKYNFRVFIKLIFYTPRWWQLFFIGIIKKIKNK